MTISIRRIIGTLFTIAFATAAINFAVDANHYCLLFESWKVAEPAHFAVDLSRPGVYESPFTQTCSSAHSESVQLRLTPAADPTTSLAGLKGSLEILDDVRTPIFTAAFPDHDFVRRSAGKPAIDLAYFQPFSRGNYTLRMTVTDPAPALAGREQLVFARYNLCGMEQMPALIAAVFSAGSALFALIVGIPTLLGFLRHGIRVA
jgi:hypothetical protein